MMPEEMEKWVRRVLKVWNYLRDPRKILIFEISMQVVLRIQEIKTVKRRTFSAWLTGAEQFQKERYYCNDNLEKGKKQNLNILNLDYAAGHFTKRENKQAKKSQKYSYETITKNYIYLINILNICIYM